jgi:hypothetical protein
LLHFSGVATQPVGHARQGTPEASGRFDGHHAVGQFAQDMSRSEPLEILMVDALQKAFASLAITGISGNGINQAISIDENRGTGKEIVKRHGSPKHLRPGR